MEDKKIVQLLFARAENAISELSTRFGKQLYRIAYNILENQLESKSRESRYIFIRRYWFGDSVGEIARDLKMQENAVSVRLNRIRNGLKEYLKKEGYHYEA